MATTLGINIRALCLEHGFAISVCTAYLDENWRRRGMVSDPVYTGDRFMTNATYMPVAVGAGKYVCFVQQHRAPSVVYRVGLPKHAVLPTPWTQCQGSPPRDRKITRCGRIRPLGFV